ncbi:MAG TPA: glycosyltransferase [Nitrososphaerales archaeon]|nr:glycosyltransferase [Nitrososphaerales archaeon]
MAASSTNTAIQSIMWPTVTIGIPTYNREWSLRPVLDSILKFEYEKKLLRICFVDNNSSDKTRDVIKEFQQAFKQQYENITLDVVTSNISKARNLCFERARGTDYIFFLDSDIIAPQDTIKRLVTHFLEDDKLAIASLPWDEKNSRKRAGIFYNAFVTPKPWGYAYKVGNGCNIISMKAYHVTGGFNERLRVHEDGELCFRMRKAGYRIICDFSSKAVHLRDINVNAKFWFNFMKDSAETYLELFKDRSPLIIAKYASSLALVTSFIVALILLNSLAAWGTFVAVAIFTIWLNSDKRALDDGIYTRLSYRPIIGAIFTVATFGVTVISILKALGIMSKSKS